MKKIIWQQVFKREGFPYFILHLGLEAYLNRMKKEIGWGYRDQLFVLDNNIVTSYYSTRDADSFKKFISKKPASFINKINKEIRSRVKKSENGFKKITAELKNNKITDTRLIYILESFNANYADVSSIYRFPTLVDEHYPHLNEMIINDCAKTKDVCGYFFTKINNIVLKNLQKKLADALKIKEEFIFCLSLQELIKSLKDNISAVNVKDLENRYNFLILAGVNGKQSLLTGSEAKKNYKSLNIQDNIKPNDANLITGKSVFLINKKIIGQVNVIKSVKELKKINKKIILVTPMTTVAFAPFMKNVMAIITDEGGLTCHAAIVSRELKIPCVIGTKFATKVLKDGDLVEVDADKGIVKIIK